MKDSALQGAAVYACWQPGDATRYEALFSRDPRGDDPVGPGPGAWIWSSGTWMIALGTWTVTGGVVTRDPCCQTPAIEDLFWRRYDGLMFQALAGLVAQRSVEEVLASLNTRFQSSFGRGVRTFDDVSNIVIKGA